MIIKINDKYDIEKVKRTLKNNNIDYKNITDIAYDLGLRDDVDSILDSCFRYEENYEKLSEKDIEDIYNSVKEDLMEYDFSEYNNYIYDCIEEWMKENN